ncbi:Hypothetical protein GL50581_779 [Giardia duodenalis ATCC 50581]|uniref:Uncharacterized protein n=1 Tax=Giardia intestinalis (strain ATCC 50581 / GS clone H7) TaxID=598745 RepID=C6LPV9_GIAIB|nr:Hypothetical protein GL50581_779 [Giardia intestinalis ATCC 50581]
MSIIGVSSSARRALDTAPKLRALLTLFAMRRLAFSGSGSPPRFWLSFDSSGGGALRQFLTRAFRPRIAGSETSAPACLMLAIMRAPWWMSIASSVWFGMCAGIISFSSPRVLCRSSFDSLRCSASCLAFSQASPQIQHECVTAARRNVFGLSPPSMNSRSALWGSRRYDRAPIMWIGSSRALLLFWSRWALTVRAASREYVHRPVMSGSFTTAGGGLLAAPGSSLCWGLWYCPATTSSRHRLHPRSRLLCATTWYAFMASYRQNLHLNLRSVTFSYPWSYHGIAVQELSRRWLMRSRGRRYACPHVGHTGIPPTRFAPRNSIMAGRLSVTTLPTPRTLLGCRLAPTWRRETAWRCWSLLSRRAVRRVSFSLCSLRCACVRALAFTFWS